MDPTHQSSLDDVKTLPEIMATLARDAGFAGAVRDAVVAPPLTLGTSQPSVWTRR